MLSVRPWPNESGISRSNALSRVHNTATSKPVMSAQKIAVTATTPRYFPSINSARQTGFASKVSAVRLSISLKNNCAVAAIVNAAPKNAIAP